MPKSGGVEEDLRYVRSVLDVAGSTGQPAAVYYLWAVLSFMGLSVIDFRPELAGPFWAFAGPLGGIASGILGWKAARASGQESRAEGFRHMRHWLGMMVAIFLTIPLQVPKDVGPSVILLIIAFSYYTAGIYLDRRLSYIGILTAACYLATVFVQSWPFIWTFTGSVLAVSLATAGILAHAPWRRSAAASRP